jgi:peroxiredoxin Q/BCP
MLEVGAAVPTIQVRNDTGDSVSLAAFTGQRVIVFFYPKSDTPACTAEACEFRDDLGAFSDLGVTVVGVSPDPVKAQAKFKAKFSLPFMLLADEDHALAEAFGVWGLKKFMGREYMGVARTTFIVEADGTVGHVFEGVTAKGHARQVLDYLRS